MKAFYAALLGFTFVSMTAFGGDEVYNGRVDSEAPTKEDEQFCMIDPSTDEEVCVAKSKETELKKKLKKTKKPKAPKIKTEN